MKNLNIYTFLYKFGIEVSENETTAKAIEMLKNHICVNYNDTLYYIPKEYNTSKDNEVFEHLSESNLMVL